ncbi:MAG TPA: dienelactone hydrolase family protein [Nitrospiria bacterium]|jgi:dienelactone hydrolase
MGLQGVETLVKIKADRVALEGALELPSGTEGIVLFAHGSGSSRHSPRNNFVAKSLREAGLGTLLMDLLSEEEDQTYEKRFDINLLTRRLDSATQWLKQDLQTNALAVGYFGSSTGAAASLKAAAQLGSMIKAVVSRGGRPDLAEESLDRVQTPTLLIVGGNDFPVIELNRQAYNQLKGEKSIIIIPGATHLFEEPGALEEVAREAANWFKRFLKANNN